MALCVCTAPLEGSDMKKIMIAATAALALTSGAAEARGCLKGALVGGVAGHFAGHHALVGAAGGCARGSDSRSDDLFAPEALRGVGDGADELCEDAAAQVRGGDGGRVGMGKRGTGCMGDRGLARQTDRAGWFIS